MQIAKARISFITQIQFEFGAIGLLKQQRQRIGIRRQLIVTDRGLKAAGIIATTPDALGHAASRAGTVTFYDGTPPNPNEAAVREAVGAYMRRHCDGIVDVGGGSSIDLAKGVAVCAAHDDPLQSFAVIEGRAEVGPSVRAMTERLDLPTGLAPLGVTRAMFPDIVQGALKDHSHRGNPRVASDTDDEAMLETSM